MNFINTIKSFFKGTKVDPVTVASRNAFFAAGDVYFAASDAVETYTNRANKRYAILIVANTAHGQAIANPTDQADFEPYTETYLDAHTSAIDTLSVAFDNLTAALAAVHPAGAFYADASALYKSVCTLYTDAVDAYSHAASCALITALEGNHQSVRDEFKVMLLEASARNAADAVTAKAKTTAFKAKVDEDAANFRILEHKSRIAETKAEAFLAKARSAETRIEEALKMRQ